MQETTDNKDGIISIIERAQFYNLEIGYYVEHFINDNFKYVVRLSNGRIIIPLGMAQDQEVQPESISEDRIQNVAKSFENNNPKIIEHNNLNEQNKGFWHRLLNFIRR